MIRAPSSMASATTTRACTPPEQCRYDLAVQIGVGLRSGPDVQVMDYEEGDYACMHFVGTGPEISAAWAQMGTPGQIPDGWEWEPRAALEIYDENFAVDRPRGAFRAGCVFGPADALNPMGLRGQTG